MPFADGASLSTQGSKARKVNTVIFLLAAFGVLAAIMLKTGGGPITQKDLFFFPTSALMAVSIAYGWRSSKGHKEREQEGQVRPAVSIPKTKTPVSDSTIQMASFLIGLVLCIIGFVI